MSRTRVHNLNVSLDGYAAGEHVTTDTPIGGAEELFAAFDGRVIHGVQNADGPVTAAQAFTAMWSQGVGAEIMGRRKFGPQSGPWDEDDDWRGWWGDEPPFRTPVFVLTHHPRPPVEFANGTTFHFIDAAPEEALERAREAANGQDVRLGGGPSSVRQFLQAELVDFLHLVIQPLVLGRSMPLWAGLDDIQRRFDIHSVVTPDGRVHQFWNRTTG